MRATITDRDGRFAFDGVDDGDYLVSGSARNHLGASHTVHVESTTDTTFVDLTLTPTGTFTGFARLENASNHRSTVVYVNQTSNVAATDSTGRYILRDVPVGGHTLIATHAHYLDATASATLGAAGDSVEVAPVTLRLDRNIPPVADAATSGSCSNSPVQFIGHGTDADGVIVRYEWDFDDDGVIDYSSPSSGVTSMSLARGARRARFTVTDDHGAIRVTVINLSISSPDTFYVSHSTGSAGGDGSKGSPFLTLGQGLAAVASSPCIPPVLYVSSDTYNESASVSFPVLVYGGMDPSTWTHSSGAYTTLEGGVTALTVSGISGTSAGFFAVDIRSSNAVTPGASSVALKVVNSGNALAFGDCRFTARNGAAAGAGPNGTTGLNGGPGTTPANYTGCGLQQPPTGYGGSRVPGRNHGRYGRIWRVLPHQ